MKYALLIYAPPGGAANAKPAEGVFDSWLDYTVALNKTGALLAAQQLDTTDTATSVRVRDAERLLTDGPFMETKEHLGGFYLIDVPDLDTALDWAAQMPIMRYGTVEVRPVKEGQAWQAGLTITAAALERAYREEWTSVVATVARRLGDLQTAEDAASEAFIAAARTWPRDGIPPKPGAWLTVTAWRKAVDQLRARQHISEFGLAPQLPADSADELAADPEEATMEDDRLGLIFACCHPALALEVRVALTLRYVAGPDHPGDRGGVPHARSDARAAAGPRQAEDPSIRH